MPNVMDGINKMQDKDLSMQLATLKTVTISNVFSEMGQKASNTTVKLFNGLRKLFDAEPVKKPEIVSIDKRIAECRESLCSKTHDELIEETRVVLIEKMNSIDNCLARSVSDDALSICIIEAACQNFKKEINNDLSPSQKADGVYQRYNERLIAQTRKNYEKASDAEKKRINEQLQEGIDSLSDEQREEMKKALRVEEVTGETLKKFLTTSVGTSALLIALNVSGFGAFMALTTIMHAVFTTTLGITLPFAAYTTGTSILSFFLGPAGWILLAGAEIFMFNKNKKKLVYELMSQVVWASVLKYGGRFTPKDESLPSWLPKEQRDVVVEHNKEFMNLLNNFNSLLEKLNDQEKEIKKRDELQGKRESAVNSFNEKISKQEEEIEKAMECKAQLENELKNAKMEFEKYKEYADSQNQSLRQQYVESRQKYEIDQFTLEMKNDELLSLQKSNNYYKNEINVYEEEIQKLSIEKKQLEEQNTRIQSNLDKMEGTVHRAELKETKKLQERWEAAYKRFEFDTGVIKSVVKQYEYNEYGRIERRLMELHEAKDPAALSSNKGKMAVSGELHLEVSTPTGFPSRIFYLPLKNAGGGKTVRITKICKHNNSKYGK